jgi:hypothetical protein
MLKMRLMMPNDQLDDEHDAAIEVKFEVDDEGTVTFEVEDDDDDAKYLGLTTNLRLKMR